MPLNCDCYGGCWGVHAIDRGWHKVPVNAQRLVRLLLPYGSYVIDVDYIRVETVKMQKDVLEAMDTEAWKEQGKRNTNP